MKRFPAPLLVCIVFAAISLFIGTKQAFTSPPQEKYKFTDVKTIYGTEGDFLDPVVFERTTSLGDSEFIPGSTYITKTRPRLKTGCFLVLLKIESFSNDGTQGILREQPIDQPPKGVKLCDAKTQQAFLEKPIRIDNSAILTVVDKNVNITVRLKTNATKPEQIPDEYREDEVTIEGPSGPNSTTRGGRPTAFIDSDYISFTLRSTDSEPGAYKACSKLAKKCTDFTKEATKHADVTIQSEELIEGKRTGGVLDGKSCKSTADCANPLICVNNACSDPDAKPPPPAPPPPCAKYEGNKCVAFNTSFGDIETDAEGFIRGTFGVILSLSGAVALFLIIRAGYKIMTSEGKPEPLQEGRDQLIAAIVGLLFLIFSFVMLQLIGVDILKIPGFGGPTGEGNQCDPFSSKTQCSTGLSCVPVGGTKNGVCTDTSDKKSVSNTPVITPPTPVCIDVLNLGSSGNCVKGLQFYLKIPVTGTYDHSTEDAVRKYQTENGLYPDGDAGPCTLGKLSGYTVDPICDGPLTGGVIRKFQEEKGLVIDGKFNYCTWLALIDQNIPNSCKP